MLEYDLANNRFSLSYAPEIPLDFEYTNDQTDEGAAFLFLGGPTGLDNGGTRIVGDPLNADWISSSLAITGPTPDCTFASQSLIGDKRMRAPLAPPR